MNQGLFSRKTLESELSEDLPMKETFSCRVDLTQKLRESSPQEQPQRLLCSALRMNKGLFSEKNLAS
jgi:hypothetical protein